VRNGICGVCDIRVLEFKSLHGCLPRRPIGIPSSSNPVDPSGKSNGVELIDCGCSGVSTRLEANFGTCIVPYFAL